MMTLHKQLIIDERGNPTAVVIPWPEFVELEEMLGLDLDAEAHSDLAAARADREAGNQAAFLGLDAI